MSGRGQNQDEARNAGVELLAIDRSLRRLYVLQARDAFDGHLHRHAIDDGVERPLVASDRNRHFRSPSQAGMHVTSQSGQKLELPDVSDRTPAWVDTHRQVEPHSRHDTCGIADRECPARAAFAATNFALRNAGRLTERGLRDPGAASSAPNLVTKLDQEVFRAPGGAVDHAFV